MKQIFWRNCCSEFQNCFVFPQNCFTIAKQSCVQNNGPNHKRLLNFECVRELHKIGFRSTCGNTPTRRHLKVGLRQGLSLHWDGAILGTGQAHTQGWNKCWP